jgi:hypothetical protein
MGINPKLSSDLFHNQHIPILPKNRVLAKRDNFLQVTRTSPIPKHRARNGVPLDGIGLIFDSVLNTLSDCGLLFLKTSEKMEICPQVF